MDWIIVIALGAIFGGFYGIGVALVCYIAFWVVIGILAAAFT